MLTESVNLSGLTRLPLPVRRKALRVLWQTRRLLGHKPTFGLHNAFTYTMRVSIAEASRLDAEVAFHDVMSTLEWAALIKRSTADLQADATSVVFDNPELLEQLSRNKAPLILTPLHMGCFALPFAKMMQDYFADRPMLILRARDDMPEETLAMKRIADIGVDMRFLNVREKQDYFNAVRFARNGAVIVNFVDLPASYGGAVSVNLFGRPARLAMGLNSLARLTGATVLPLAVNSSTRGDIVRLGRPFESYETGGAEKARVAAIVRQHIEQSILAAPEQWHMWPRLNEFFDAGEQNEAA